MLTTTRWFSRPSANNNSTPVSADLQTAGPVVNGNSTAAAPARTQNDQLALTQQSQTRNPFEGVSPGFSRVKVDKWGEGDNGSVLQILINQGYSSSEIYRKGSDGKTLLDEVSRVNNLRNPNLVRAGQDLVVPSKTAPQNEAQTEQQTQAPVQQPAQQPTQQPAQQPTTTEPTQTAVNQEREPAVNTVKIDKWGEGPNSSLGAILKSQGFEHNEIFREDSNGDSLLKKVARANGLSDPNMIQAGRTLQVPNSTEALGQMNIPEMAAQQRPTNEEAAQPPATTQPEATTPPVTQPNNETAPPATETTQERPPVTQPVEQTTPPAEQNTQPTEGSESEVTANMGMLLNGVKNGEFTRTEFQYLNARSSRYTQMRARYAEDGYSNAELTELGRMERRYGVEFARLSASDNVSLPSFPATTNDPDLQLQVRHYHESGPMYDRYRSGSASTEDSLSAMVRQRAEARQQETR